MAQSCIQIGEEELKAVMAIALAGLISSAVVYSHKMKFFSSSRRDHEKSYMHSFNISFGNNIQPSYDPAPGCTLLGSGMTLSPLA